MGPRDVGDRQQIYGRNFGESQVLLTLGRSLQVYSGLMTGVLISFQLGNMYTSLIAAQVGVVNDIQLFKMY